MHDPSLQAVRRAAAFESTVLENGLTVRVHTMPGFTGVHAVYGTKFGSIDRAFALDGKRVDLPAGIAHFLEHKMFENEEGDAFTLYARTAPAPTPTPVSTRPATFLRLPATWPKIWIFCWALSPGRILRRQPWKRNRASSGRRSSSMTTRRTGG